MNQWRAKVFFSKTMKTSVHGGMKSRRRTTFKKKDTSKEIAQIKRAIGSIKKSQELKWIDNTGTAVSAGDVVPLNNIPLGDDQNSRDGCAILMKSCIIHVFATTSSAFIGAPRAVLVYDKVPNGLLPVYSDIFTTNGTTAQVNNYNKDRFTILYDNYAGLKRGSDPYQVGGADPQNARFIIDDYVKLNHKARYGPTGSGTTAGTKTGALYMVYLGGGNVTQFVSNIRVQFLDS